jgi:thymidylate synthase (FAD)
VIDTHTIALLDHGYVMLVETWGSDERIVEAARMSTAKGFLRWGTPEEPGDERLLRYLWDNRHATPFEMAGATLEIQAPIFVFREWQRHRTQSYNELSSRYTPLPDTNYVPTVERLMVNAGASNKQAGTVKGAAELNEINAQAFRDQLVESYAKAQDLYQWALDNGVPKELARLHLPVGRYSRMRASANLRNWLAFLTLRMAPNAQWEIRQYANVVSEIVAARFPRTHELFARGML